MVNTKTGKPLSFEILLLSSPTLERVAVPYTQQLKKIGIDARVRTVDPRNTPTAFAASITT
jgi:microcin C transport system substrate-binding protein